MNTGKLNYGAGFWKLAAVFSVPALAVVLLQLLGGVAMGWIIGTAVLIALGTVGGVLTLLCYVTGHKNIHEFAGFLGGPKK